MSDYTVFHGELLDGVNVDAVLRQYFPDYSYKGVFIDVGAFEPIRISNSYHFEKNNWDVYCFEANTGSIPLLKQHRKNVYNFAIYNENKDEVSFNVVVSNGWTAGFSAIELDKDIANVFRCDNKQISVIRVPQRTLTSMLENELSHISAIDILKIDVEGGEFKVLAGLDFTRFAPKIILLENICKIQAIRVYLESKGYTLDKEISYNQFYKRMN
jgi:FkbM family methyltransferase